MCKYEWDVETFTDKSVALNCTLCKVRIAVGTSLLIWDASRAFVGRLDLEELTFNGKYIERKVTA